MRPFRILLVGHGKLPAALLASAELIAGPIEDISAISLHAHETPDHLAAAVADAAGRDRRPVLVLTDLQGGTPHNVATALGLRDPRLACVSGVNLAMLLEAALGLDRLDGEALARLVEVGRAAIWASSWRAASTAPMADGAEAAAPRRRPDRPDLARRAS
ncbi:MAG TPA: hypothetical protein VF763_00970 [Candidatus Limnocylindrales bacterium]